MPKELNLAIIGPAYRKYAALAASYEECFERQRAATMKALPQAYDPDFELTDEMVNLLERVEQPIIDEYPADLYKQVSRARIALLEVTKFEVLRCLVDKSQKADLIRLFNIAISGNITAEKRVLGIVRACVEDKPELLTK